MTRSLDLKIEAQLDAIAIYFDGILHLHIKRSKLLGVQSWSNSDQHYVIEYTMDGGKITTDYTNKKKFETILRRLADIL